MTVSYAAAAISNIIPISHFYHNSGRPGSPGPVSTQHLQSLGRCAGYLPRHLKRYGRITREAELNFPLPARTNDLTRSPIGGEKADPKTMDDRLINTALSETEVTAIRIDHKTLQSLYACTQLGLQTGDQPVETQPTTRTPNRKRHPPASLGSECFGTLTSAPRAVKTSPRGPVGG